MPAPCFGGAFAAFAYLAAQLLKHGRFATRGYKTWRERLSEIGGQVPPG
jgi:hypothetical protein